MSAIYNEIEKYPVEWLRNLITAGHIAPGTVDGRSIVDLQPEDVQHATQAHFFAGIGVWSAALRAAGWRDEWPAWSGSCPCFPAGTLITTRRGQTAIELVVVGDEVFTHRSRWRTVTAVGTDVKPTVMLKGQGHWGMQCTPNHPFLTGDDQWERADRMSGKRWALPSVFPRSDIPALVVTRGVFFDKDVRGFRAKGEKAGRPVYLGLYKTKTAGLDARAVAIRDKSIDVRGADAVDVRSLEFARFLGYWVGDGWVTGNSVVLCGAQADTDLLTEVMTAAGLNCNVTVERTAARARCGSQVLSRWLTDNFGRGAAHKALPSWLHGTSSEYRAAFLRGYAEADGHTGSNGAVVYTTVSRALAVGVRILLNQSGLSVSIGRTLSRGGTTVIEGRVVNELPMYRVTGYTRARSFRFGGDHGWGLVRSVHSSGDARVYNIAV